MSVFVTCRRTAGSAVGLGLAVVLGSPMAASAAWEPDFEAPFTCGQEWSAETRSGHSPSYYSVDFNRPDDFRQPVRAAAPGRVSAVVDVGDTSYGKYVRVDHGNGWESLYAHLDAQLVVVGQQVDQGALVGLLGTSGGSTGPHLHFEQKDHGSVQPAVFHGTDLDYNTTIRSYNCGDVPVAGDWDGDRRSDVGVARRTPTGINFRLRMSDGSVDGIGWGGPGDVPVTGDWDGDGVTDVGVWRRMTRTFSLRLDENSAREVTFGHRRDVPVVGDWDGDGDDSVGVYSPRKQVFRLRDGSSSVTSFEFGSVSSIPVTGDWDGDGRTTVAVFDSRTTAWTFRGGATADDFGGRGGLPLGGDWNGDGVETRGVWGPANAKFRLERSREAAVLKFGHKRR